MIPLELIKRAGNPLAAPSANLSGKPSSSLAAHVIDDLAGRIDAIIDGGVAAIGLESTVIDMTAKAPIVLRPGAVGIKELEKVIGKISYGYKNDNVEIEEVSLKKEASHRYRHYIPNTKVILVEGENKSVSEKIIELRENFRNNGQKIGFLLSKETAGIFALKELNMEESFLLGSREEPEVAARKFFEGLRDLDRKGLDIIVVDGSFSHSGLGDALINRLREASSSSFTV
jgi:L-threonylcarbamoyladenylate synthase